MSPFHAIAEQLGGRLIRAWPLQGGVSAATSGIEVELADGVRRYVVRQPGGHYLRALSERDFRLMEQLSAAGLPVARPRLLDPTGETFGEPALVVDYLEGETDSDRHIVPGKIERLARQLAAIHALPTADFAGVLPELEPRAIAFFAQTPERPDEGLGETEVRAALARRPTPPRANPDAVLHGDFWPGNILWKGGEISGVIDWEDASLGDPLYDLAVSRLDLLWTYGPGAPELFTAAYLAASPRTDLTPLAWYDLGACLRPAGQISVWATSADDPAEAARRMRDRHRMFREQALAAYALLTR